MKNFRKTAGAALAALILAAFVSGCTPTHNVRGNLVEDYQLKEVVPGKDSRTDILRKLGSPTTKAPFDDNTWYYMGQDMEKRGIFDPEVKKERIIVVTFNDDGIVQDIRDTHNKRVDLPYVRDKTPTSGKDITVLQQLVGNLGKFNKDESGGDADGK